MRRFRTPASEITQLLRTSTALWRKTTTLIALLLAAAMIAVIAIAAIAILPGTSSKTTSVNAASTKPTTKDSTATVTGSAPTAARQMASLPASSPPAPSSPPDDPANTAACRQSWTYDSDGNVLTHTDRRGITTVKVYDPENRLVSETRAGLLLQTLGRDAEGNVLHQTDALGRATAFIYDKANRKLSEDRSGLAVERWTYTPLGDVAIYTDADGRTTTNTYTSRRLLESESLAGETTRYAYDGAGHRVSRERPNGPDSTWTYAYDAAGNLAAVTDPGSRTTTFGHDANNNRTRTTDANDHATTFAYDERNRLSGKTSPGGDRWRWDYDGDNNRIRSTAPNGRVADTTYDALNRATRTDYRDPLPGEVQSSAFTYDGNGNTRTVTETSSAGIRTETRGYDDFDRLTEVTDGDGRTLRYAYDAVGNRTRLTDADGHDTVWTYNDLNQNTRVTVPGMGTTSLGYAPSGRVTEISRPDGSLTEQSFFDDGRLQNIRHSKAGQTLARYDYVYDPNGNRTEQRELNGATTADATQRTRYVYDDADRLVEVQEPNRTTIYTLDAVGNRIAERVVDGNGTVISDSTLTYNARDQLTSRNDPVTDVHVVQTWDANGNLATQTVNDEPPRIYTYDARDRLVGLTLPSSPNGPTTLHFAYHADGLRREKTDGVTTTRYQYDGQSLLAETNAIGNTLRQFHYSATQLVAQTQAGTTPIHRHVLLDALRSPIALLDPTGLVTARTSYDAFGEIRAQLGTNGTLTTPNRDAVNAELVSTDNQPVGFTGYIKDSESGLYYAKARYYDPATARFTTEDPEAGKDLEPPSLHRYLYAYANPTAHTDPTGRQVCIGHEVESCPLEQWTPPNRPVPQDIAPDALTGLPGLSEVETDRTTDLRSTALPPEKHLNTELYSLVPYVDPLGNGTEVRFYDAQNKESGSSDWTVPPRQLDTFVKHESVMMNEAAFSRALGGTKEWNIYTQRELRDYLHGNITSALINKGNSWISAASSPSYWSEVGFSVAGGSLTKAGKETMLVTEGAAGQPVGMAPNASATRRTTADFAGHTDSEAGGMPTPFRRIVRTNDKDVGAESFADRFGGTPNASIEGFGNREFDMVSDQYVGQAFGPMQPGKSPAFEANGKNFLSLSRRSQIRATLDAARTTGRSALFEFTGGNPDDYVVNWIQRNAERSGSKYEIIVRDRP